MYGSGARSSSGWMSLLRMRMILSMHSTRLYSLTMAIRVLFRKMPLLPITLWERERKGIDRAGGFNMNTEFGYEALSGLHKSM